MPLFIRTREKEKGMPYEPFREDQQPVYANEHEDIVFRVKDFKTLIEEHLKLPVTGLSLMTMVDNQEHLQALYGDLQPDRIWFVFARIETPDGPKTSEVFVMLKDKKLSLPKKVFLHLETFGLSQRNKAKQDIPDLTLDYIQTLERCVSDAWRIWRDLSYYLDRHHDNPEMKKVWGFAKQPMDGLYKGFQNVGFLNTDEERQDFFPTGF